MTWVFLIPQPDNNYMKPNPDYPEKSDLPWLSEKEDLDMTQCVYDYQPGKEGHHFATIIRGKWFHWTHTPWTWEAVY